MANYLAVYLHLVWATDRRRPLLEPALETTAWRVILAKS
jgi:hypothetical protein